jgi:RNA polymerase sigma factor (sigma-70 family)
MAIKKFYQMPESFATSHTMDGWIQDALIIMFQCCQSYDGRGPFDHYVRFLVSRRLVSMQRKVFSENPPADRDLYKKVQAYKRKNKRLPKAEELAEETGFDKADIKKYLETGYGQRMVTTESETVCQNKAVKAGLSPETQFIHHEARKILRDCIEKLQPEMKMMFIRHEFDELSFKKLYEQLKIKKHSFSTFKRQYKKNVYESVENCVSSQYES